MAVLEPLKVTIINFDELSISDVLDVPDFPNDDERTEKHKISCDRVIYIERNDFRQVKLVSFSLHISIWLESKLLFNIVEAHRKRKIQTSCDR